jgi:3-deoxy-manno-octulosonate cytidylyltransferase (CMP-KDO synthetase)
MLWVVFFGERAISRRAIAIIPARYASTRFPGKPLHLIDGKTLIQRTYERAAACSALEAVIVATDDKRIFDHVIEFGGEAVMTSTDCACGTDRLAEVVAGDQSRFSGIIVNIQGDEPCISAETIEAVIEAIGDSPMATAAAPLAEEDRTVRSVVKCVTAADGRALYFSRSPLAGAYRHIGIYAFTTDFLLTYAKLAATPLQQAEDLEQLKVLEHGYEIRVAVVQETGIGVDVPEDVKRVEEWISK